MLSISHTNTPLEKGTKKLRVMGSWIEFYSLKDTNFSRGSVNNQSTETWMQFK